MNINTLRISILTIATAICHTILANNLEQTADSATQQSADTTLVLPVEFENDLDETVHSWYMNNALLGECQHDHANLKTDTLDKATTIARLQALPYVMEMPYNDLVKRSIERYLQMPEKIEYMAGIGETYYFSMFENALERYDVPLELKYLPVIESALNAQATSRVGAAGLWQFMVSTGRLYGLEVNSLVDERRDPLKASDAAARYLHDLYNIYQDWFLVIAAYNCGPGNVAKATRYAGGGKKDYWQIYPYLPRETRGYVPIFIAANYIMNYYKQHNLCPIQPQVPVVVDTITVQKRIHLQQISDLLNISLEELRFLNPQYRHNIVPGDIKPYPIVLPLNQLSAYIDNADTIPLHRASELLANRPEVNPAAFDPASGTIIYHKVRSGDTLGGIAARYHCTVGQLKRWNGLRGTMIRKGQRLKICK